MCQALRITVNTKPQQLHLMDIIFIGKSSGVVVQIQIWLQKNFRGREKVEFIIKATAHKVKRFVVQILEPKELSG